MSALPISLLIAFIGLPGLLGQEPPKCSRKNPPATVSQAALDKKRAAYPKEWEVEVPKATKLDRLRKDLDPQIAILPERDLEDRTPIPVWFRVYLRKSFSDLPTSGPYQYPRTARRVLQRLLDNPDSAALPETPKKND